MILTFIITWMLQITLFFGKFLSIQLSRGVLLCVIVSLLYPLFLYAKVLKKTDVTIIRFWDFTLNKRLVSYFTFVCQKVFAYNVNLRTVCVGYLLLVCFLFVIFVFVFCRAVVLLLWGCAWGFVCLFLA